MVLLGSPPSEGCKELAFRARVCFCGITCAPAFNFALCSPVSLSVPNPTLFLKVMSYTGFWALHSPTRPIFTRYLCTDFIFKVSSYSECQELGL